MQVNFLKADGVEKTLRGFLADYDEVHWAVAWGTHAEMAKLLLSHKSKIRAVTFGLAFSQTDPDLIESMIGVKGTRVVTRFPGGTYHPKVYIFRSKDRVAAIVGSANFTGGGLGRNHEASLCLTGTIKDQALADLLAFTADSAALGKPVTRDISDRYRLSCRIAARQPKPTRDPLEDVPTIRVAGLTSPLTLMTWPQYVRAINDSAEHDVKKSLILLGTVQGWLSTGASFQDLSTPRRKAIAGVIGMHDRATEDELDQDWGWFGSMRGAGDFMNRVAENDVSLAKAVDSIPHKGEISRPHFDRFRDLFAKAFENSDRTGGVATASRLLAMKRPDVFLCVSKPNLTETARQMAFSKSTLDLDNYWDRVVEVIRASDWYATPKPDGRQGRLWECRAAMLDAILYKSD